VHFPSEKGAAVPTYSYYCKECKKPFTLSMSLADHEKRRVTCPKCRSKKVEQQFATFFAVGAKKS
jgi:putative FmdB family regulatory protein